ncbi:MAG: T9SS type A sorting domain-containing protein [Saprospiraceae bacterium]|nr:T9SS type A sorting domain-containing protein [Saprospiraceae bacterium]
MKKACILCFALLLSALSLLAQAPPICTLPSTPGADACAGACLRCTLEGYVGQTAGFTAGAAPGFCGTVDNDQWFSFRAGSDSISITVTPSNCQQGNGLELALYPDCTQFPVACTSGQAGGGNISQTVTASVAAGQVYFLMIDGYQGDQCDFVIHTSANAVAAPLPGNAGPISGPTLFSGPNGTSIYFVAPVSGATSYVWGGSPDVLINGMLPPVQLPAPGGSQVTVTFASGNGTLCVTPQNACGQSNTSCLNVTSNANLLPPCSSSSEPAADLCQDACVYCNFNDYFGSTVGYSSQTPNGFCGTIENEQWIGLIASGVSATFTASPSNCTNGDGIQMALYTSCDDTGPIACDGGAAGNAANSATFTASLVPGTTYFLLIDGFAGDQCDFHLYISPPSAVQAPGVGATGQIIGSSPICPGATVPYTVPLVTGAGAYIWTAPPGWLINGVPPPVALAGPGANTVDVTIGTTSGALCVKPLNSCAEGTERCKMITVQPIPPTILPPVVVCAEDIAYTLPWGDDVYTSGIYSTVFTSYLGCDSIVRQQVTIKAPIGKQLAPSYLCPGESIIICGEEYSNPGVYAHVCESWQGCDSVISFSIVLLDPKAEILPAASPSCATPPLVLNSAPSLGQKLWKLSTGQVLGTGNTLTINASGTYILVTTVTAGGKSCTATDTLSITFSTESANASAAGGTLTCDLTSLALSGVSTSAGATFAWTGPGGFNSTLQNPVVSTPGAYILTVTNPASGCTAQALAEVLLDVAAPSLSVSGGTLTCAIPFSSISGSSPDPGVVFSWSGPDGFSSTQPQPSVSIPGCYTAVATAPNGCTSTATACVVADTVAPTVILNADTLTCFQPSIALQLTTIPDTGLIVEWSGGVTGPNLPVGAAGTYTVTVTNPANGCSTVATTSVWADTDAPSVSTTGGALSCAEPSLELICSTSLNAAIAAFTWTGPNNFSSSLQNPTIFQPGTYTVTVTNTRNGCQASAEAEVSAKDQLPPVSVTGATLTCQTTSVAISASTPVSPADFAWAGPNGFSATGPNPTVTEPGTYTVSVTDLSNGCSGLAEVLVVQDIQAPGAVAVGDTLTCAEPTGQLQGSSGTLGGQFAWLGPNGFSSALQNPIVTDTGRYILIVANPTNGCTSTAETYVLANFQAPMLVPMAPDLLTCTIKAVALGVSTPLTQVTYAWSGPNGFTSMETHPVVSEPGQYVLTLTDLSSGCTQDAAIGVNQDILEPGATLGGGMLTCTQTSVELQAASPTVPVALTLSGPTGVLTSNSVYMPGIYTLLVTSLYNGCTSTATTEVLENVQPPLVTVYADPVYCDTDTSFVGVPDSAGLQFLWTGPNGFQSTQAGFWVTKPGIYTVVVTRIDNGCTQAFTAPLVQTSDPLVSVEQITHDQNNQGQGAIDISIFFSGPPYTIAWYRDSISGATLVSTSEDPSGLYAGTYICVVQYSGCTRQFTATVLNITTSTHDAEEDARWEIFPNPTADEVWIRYQGADQPEAGYSIADVAGRLVLRRETPVRLPIRLQVQTLPAGTYALRIRTEKGEIRRLLVVQR